MGVLRGKQEGREDWAGIVRVEDSALVWKTDTVPSFIDCVQNLFSFSSNDLWKVTGPLLWLSLWRCAETTLDKICS